MEEVELNAYPIGLIKSSDIYVNISFCNNVRTFEKSVKLHTQEGFMFLDWMGVCSLGQESSSHIKAKFFSTYKLYDKWKCQVKHA